MAEKEEEALVVAEAGTGAEAVCWELMLLEEDWKAVV